MRRFSVAVFYDHLYGSSPQLRHVIERLIDTRTRNGIHCRSTVRCSGFMPVGSGLRSLLGASGQLHCWRCDGLVAAGPKPLVAAMGWGVAVQPGGCWKQKQC